MMAYLRSPLLERHDDDNNLSTHRSDKRYCSSQVPQIWEGEAMVAAVVVLSKDLVVIRGMTRFRRRSRLWAEESSAEQDGTYKQLYIFPILFL